MIQNGCDVVMLQASCWKKYIMKIAAFQSLKEIHGRKQHAISQHQTLPSMLIWSLMIPECTAMLLSMYSPMIDLRTEVNDLFQPFCLPHFPMLRVETSDLGQVIGQGKFASRFARVSSASVCSPSVDCQVLGWKHMKVLPSYELG